jgi:hypothetical protein
LARISQAFRSFFQLLFSGELSPELIRELGLMRASKGGAKQQQPTPAAAVKPAPAAPQIKVTDGALQILGILQRDSRLIDFLMEDISSYSDDQVGAAVRDLQQQARASLDRYLQMAPVIDGVEGTPTRLEAAQITASEIKLLGNVPAGGKAAGGTLRHRGWRAVKMDLPPIPSGANPQVIAPAEVEIE